MPPSQVEVNPLLRAAVAIAPSFVLSRALLIVVSCTVAAAQHVSLLSVWNRWDARWYVGIAAHGYHWSLDGKPSLAFFPLYPLLVHCVSLTGVPRDVAALVLSNAAFGASLLYLYLLVDQEACPPAAWRATWLLALFPTAFFTFAPYTESLFLLSAIATVYHARRGNARVTGAWLAAAVATRATGLTLVPAALLAMNGQTWRRRLLMLFPAVASLSAYLWYLQRHHLQIQRLLTAQRAWHRALAYPWTGFVASASWPVRHGIVNFGWAVENVFQLGVTILFLALTVAAWRHLGRAQAAYCAAFWLLVLISPQWLDDFYAPFSSMDRFVLALFPLAGWAALRLTARGFRRTLAWSGTLMACLAALHLAGGWVG
ncbi:MAG: mannosyltransferase family protein [Chloroflexota bacterium]